MFLRFLNWIYFGTLYSLFTGQINPADNPKTLTRSPLKNVFQWIGQRKIHGKLGVYCRICFFSFRVFCCRFGAINCGRPMILILDGLICKLFVLQISSDTCGLAIVLLCKLFVKHNSWMFSVRCAALSIGHCHCDSPAARPLLHHLMETGTGTRFQSLGSNTIISKSRHALHLNMEHHVT